MHVSFTGAGRETLDHALSRAPDHWVPLFQAVRDFEVGLTMVGQGRERFAIAQDRPHMLIIGDDMAAALGPRAFHERSLRRYLPRCRVAVIVACEPLVDAYLRAITPTMALGFDTVLIETRPDREAEWAELLDQLCPKAQRTHATVIPEGRA